jgi:hypothetical protein
MAAILEREAPALDPEWLNRVVRACLAKDPADRVQTVRDLKRAIGGGTHGRSETFLCGPIGQLRASGRVLVQSSDAALLEARSKQLWKSGP